MQEPESDVLWGRVRQYHIGGFLLLYKQQPGREKKKPGILNVGTVTADRQGGFSPVVGCEGPVNGPANAEPDRIISR